MEYFLEANLSGVLTFDVLRDGSPCTNEYPKQQVSSKTAKIAKRIKKEKYLNGNISQNT